MGQIVSIIRPNNGETYVAHDLVDLHTQLQDVNTLFICLEGRWRSKDACDEVVDGGYLDGGLIWLRKVKSVESIYRVLGDVANIVLYITPEEYRQYQEEIQLLQEHHNREIQWMSELPDIFIIQSRLI